MVKKQQLSVLEEKFSSEDEDSEEYDWDEVFQKQFIPFIKQITGGGSKGCATTADEDDENEDVDYDELPFTIYKQNVTMHQQLKKNVVY